MKNLLYDFIGPLVFPAPECPASYYRMLETRSELTILTSSEGEKVPMVLCKPHHSTAASTGYTLLYSHGNAEDLSLIFTFLQEMANFTGSDVISYDYVGYSFSKLEGAKPSEQGCLRSIDAVWRHATEILGIPANKIILFGRSIGAGPTVDLAVRDAPFVEGLFPSQQQKQKFQANPLDAAGVILQSPLSSGTRVLTGVSPVGMSASFVLYGLDIFRNYLKIGKIKAPVAVMHGTQDEVVPCSNGRNLQKLAQNPYEPLWLDGRGHNDLPFHEVFGYAKRFVESLRKPSG